VPKISIANRAGEMTTLEADDGLTVMEIIRDGGLHELQALCRGCCSCATCHVYVDEAWVAHLPEITADENDLLEGSAHRRPESRLSCQLPFSAALDGLKLRIAPED